MITKLSYQLAETLCHYVKKEEEIDHVRYGFEVILGGLLKLLVMLLIASFLGIVPIMFATFLTFAIIRSLTGGVHFSTYTRCLCLGILLMVGASFIALLLASYLDKTSVYLFLGLATLFALIFTHFYAPSNHNYKSTSQTKKRRLRQLSFFIIILWSLVVFSLLTMNYSHEIILASILGLVFQISSIHPAAYTFTNKIEFVLDWRKKE